MAKYQVRDPAGNVRVLEGPDGASDADIVAAAHATFGDGESHAQEVEKPGLLESGAGSLSHGIGNVVYGGQRLLGRGLQAIGAEQTGKSLVQDADERTAVEDAKFHTYQDAHPAAAAAGDLAGNVVGTLPVGGMLGLGLRGLGAAGVAAADAAGVAPGAVAAVRSVAGPMTQAVESAGLRAGPSGSTMGAVAANLGTRAAGGAITGGVSAGLVNPDDAKTGAAIGAALPGGAWLAGKAAHSAGHALTGEISPEVQALAKRAADLGIDVPADRIANSKPLNAVAAGLNYVPFSGRAAVENRMQDQLNEALTKTFGQDSANVTAALRKAKGELGEKFDDALQHGVTVDPQFVADLTHAQAMASNELGSDGANIIHKQIGEIYDKAQDTGALDGQAAYNIKKTLDRIGNRNSPEAYYANELKRSLMGALNRSLGPEDAAAFKTVRQQYGSMLDLGKIAQNGADGDVSIARIANMKNINNPDLQELADISAQFLKPREGQHGAAQRAFAGLGLGYVGGVKSLGSSVAAGRVANTILDSNMARNRLMRSAVEQQALEQTAPSLLGQSGDWMHQLAYRAAPQTGDR